MTNYKYPLYAPWWKVDAFKKSWYNTLSSLFKMINVKDNGDGSFIIEWDENDPAESIFNDWTKEDFIQFFQYAAERDFNLSKDAEKSGEESGETSNISEATEEDYQDFWEGDDISEQENDTYVQATNEDTFWEVPPLVEGDELSEDRDVSPPSNFPHFP